MTDSHDNVLPEAVRKQVEEADALIAQMNLDQGGQPPAEPANDLAIGVDPAAVAPVAPIVAPSPTPAAEPAPEPAPELAKPREDWKQKYSVLQGKYDAEVPRLHAEQRENKQTISGLQTQLTTLQTTVEMLKATRDDNAPAPAPLVSEEEIEQFGPDLIDVVKRVAQEAVSPYVDKKVGEVSQSMKQVNESVASTQKTVAESARGRLYERLDNEVPGWDSINKDATFVNWLREEDGLSGQLRGNVLRGAFDQNDAERVVKIFKSFQNEHVVETSDPNSDAPAGEVTPESQQPLDGLVAPGTPKTGSIDAQEESGKRIWTHQAIKDFYLRKNEWVRSRPNDELPSEMAAEERDIFLAQRENRVRT